MNSLRKPVLLTILAGLFAWLQSAQYLPHNPWMLVNRDFGDDPGKRLLDTRALSEEAIDALSKRHDVILY